MAGNQSDSDRSTNASPHRDCGPQGRPQGDDNTSGYDEQKPTSVAERDTPDPTIAGNQSAQTGTEPTPSDPYDPDIDQPVPPGDVPSKTPIKEPERGEAQYVGGAGDSDPQAIYSDAASPVVPGPADGAD